MSAVISEHVDMPTDQDLAQSAGATSLPNTTAGVKLPTREQGLASALLAVLDLTTAADGGSFGEGLPLARLWGMRRVVKLARVTPDMHGGVPPELFGSNRLRVSEWILGQLAALIDEESPHALTVVDKLLRRGIEDGRTVLPAEARPQPLTVGDLGAVAMARLYAQARAALASQHHSLDVHLGAHQTLNWFREPGRLRHVQPRNKRRALVIDLRRPPNPGLWDTAEGVMFDDSGGRSRPRLFPNEERIPALAADFGRNAFCFRVPAAVSVSHRAPTVPAPVPKSVVGQLIGL
jgi:hypothetical protein